MGKERTPPTGTIREAFMRCHPFPHTTEIDERGAEFDRWLAKIQAEAWEQGYAVGHAHGFGDGTQPDQRANPYRKDENENEN